MAILLSIGHIIDFLANVQYNRHYVIHRLFYEALQG